MNGPTRKKLYECVAKRDGEYCKGCGALPHERQLVLDHKDNNNANNDPTNHQLLCRRCNYLKNPRRPVDICECENEAQEHTSELDESRVKEPLFRKYVLHQLNEYGNVPEKELIDSGAEVVGISPVTAKRYLDKMCSLAGLLKRSRFVKTVVIGYKKDLVYV